MTILNRNIWFINWNIEYGAPSDTQLRIILNDIKNTPPKEKPDFIFVGTQETVPSSRGQFMAERLGEKLPGYVYRDVGQIKGITKLGKGDCYQHLGFITMLGDSYDIKNFYSHTRVLGYPSLTKLKSKSEKGGIVAVFDYHNVRIAVISCHITGNKESQKESRSRDLHKILASLLRVVHKDRGKQPLPPVEIYKKLDPIKVYKNLVEHFGLIFLMGDLNYRIAPDDTNHPFIKLGKRLSLDQMVDLVMSPEGREALIRCDPIRKSSICTDYHFIFPDPKDEDGNIIFPTYKRVYKKITEANNPCYQFHAYREKGKRGFGGLPENRMKELLKKCYFPKEKHWSDDRKCFEMGWLDRVGFLHGKAATNFRVKVNSFHDYPHLSTSDHSCVVLKTTISHGNGHINSTIVRNGYYDPDFR